MAISPEALARRRTYDVWRQMLKRCEDPSCTHYRYYGGRGISVCPSWHSFPTFLADMGVKPDGYSIDREDVNGNYEPENCRWIPMDQQAATRRSAIKRIASTPEILRMRALGVTQQSIEEALGVDQTTISRVLTKHGKQSRVAQGRRSWRPA